MLATVLLAVAVPVRAQTTALGQLGAAAGAEPPVYRAAPRPPLLSPGQEEAVGRLIWRNEGAGKVSALTHWNDGEEFASMGIGHFIWYPAGVTGAFTEDFPDLVRFLEKSGASVPAWLRGGPPCPWRDRASFFADFDKPRLAQLRTFLAKTFRLQARYIAERSRRALPRVLDAAPAAERAALERRYSAVAACANGVYALVDYVNFKGEGVSIPERYNGQGWGLLQVLQEMRDAKPGQASAVEFSAAAERVLARRVANSPPARNEARWLPGWTARVRTYRDPL